MWQVSKPCMFDRDPILKGTQSYGQFTRLSALRRHIASLCSKQFFDTSCASRRKDFISYPAPRKYERLHLPLREGVARTAH
jgi:hypothetical protein